MRKNQNPNIRVIKMWSPKVLLETKSVQFVAGYKTKELCEAVFGPSQRVTITWEVK